MGDALNQRFYLTDWDNVAQDWSLGSQWIDTSTDAAENIIQVERDVTITQVALRKNSITGTSPTYSVTIEGVDSNGNPDGTDVGGGSPTKTTFDPTSWTGTTWVTLDNSYAASAGEWIAITIKYESGTIDASNRAQFTYQVNQATKGGAPYAIANNAGSRSRGNGGTFGLANSDKSIVQGLISTSRDIHTFNSGTNPDERGMKFMVPSQFCSTYTILACEVLLDAEIAGNDTFDVILYSGSDTTAANSTGAVTETTVQQNVSSPANVYRTNNYQDHVIYFDESSLVTLYADAWYRMMIRATSANDIRMFSHDVTDVDDWNGDICRQNAYYSSRNNATGNFTDDTLKKLGMSIRFDDITAPAGGGGGSCVIGGSIG